VAARVLAGQKKDALQRARTGPNLSASPPSAWSLKTKTLEHQVFSLESPDTKRIFLIIRGVALS